MASLSRIKIQGYKSICDQELTLGTRSVLIGANGAGKSNFISFLRMLNWTMTGALQDYIGRGGGASSLLHYGPSITKQIIGEFEFKTEMGTNSYLAELTYAAGDTLIYTNEELQFARTGYPPPALVVSLGAGHRESKLKEKADEGDKTAKAAGSIMSGWRVYQFHDTSDTAMLRQHHYIEDYTYLRSDAGNLSAYLYMLQQTRHEYYQRIVSTIIQIAPFFSDFDLHPSELNRNHIILNWRERGRDSLFGPHQLSDGTLRMMALVTLLLQPPDKLPEVLIIDEPELGLHPYAISVVAKLMKSVSHYSQLILATQSAQLLDEFDPEDVVVVDRIDGCSTFQRLAPDKLTTWLEEYSLSELWDKNVIGGRPAR